MGKNDALFTESMQTQFRQRIIAEFSAANAAVDAANNAKNDSEKKHHAGRAEQIYASAILKLSNYIKTHAASTHKDVRTEMTLMLRQLRETIEKTPTSNPQRNTLLKIIGAGETCTTTSTQTLRDSILKAIEHFSIGMPFTAQQEETKPTPLSAEKRQARSKHAQQKFFNYDHTGAIEIFNALIASNHHCDDYMFRAMLHLYTRQYQSAIADGNEALLAIAQSTLDEKQKAAFYLALSDAYLHLIENLNGNTSVKSTDIKRLHNTCLTHLVNSLTHSSESCLAVVYFKLARLFFLQDRYQLAIHYCLNTLQQNPAARDDVYALLCHCYIRLGNIVEAQNTLAKISQKDKNHQLLLKEIQAIQPASARENHGEEKQATPEPIRQKLPELQRRAISQIGMMAFEQGKYHDALDTFTMLIDLNQATDDYMLRALTYAKLEKNVEAIADGEKALAIMDKDTCHLPERYQEDFYYTNDRLILDKIAKTKALLANNTQPTTGDEKASPQPNISDNRHIMLNNASRTASTSSSAASSSSSISPATSSGTTNDASLRPTL